MGPFISSDLPLPSLSPQRSSESPTPSPLSITTSEPAAKSRPAPTSNQGAVLLPRKRFRPDTPPQAPSPNTASALPLVSLKCDDLTDADCKSLDDKIIKQLSRIPVFDRELDLPVILSLISTERRFVTLTVNQAEEVLKREPLIAEILMSGWQAGSFKDVRRLECLWPQAVPVVQRPRQMCDYDLPRRVSNGQSESATLQSWDIKYVGGTANLLYRHLASFPKEKLDEDSYARYTSIVQSSGTGKSRAIDELSKEHLVLPLCLREGSTGFPPPDDNVRDWLLKGNTKMEAFTRASAFLCALFIVLLRYLQEIDANVAILPLSEDGPPKDPQSREDQSRLLMTVGQTFFHHGQQRTQFYAEVLDLADNIWSPSESTPGKPLKPMPPSPKLSFGTVEDAEGNTDLKEAIRKLMDYLIKDFDIEKHYPPAIIIAFDEAHSLAMTENDSMDGLWSKFSELRRALRVIHSYPCFSVFLSTTGKISQFMPPRINDLSSRLQQGLLSLLSPFCELGFDQLAEKAISGQTTLDKVSSLKFMALLSRPLFASRYITGDDDIKKSIVTFAGEKLLCRSFSSSEDFSRTSNLTDMEKMACMSVRIPLEFNTGNTSTLRSLDMEMMLVEKHMRLCLSVDSGFETAVTVAPSEPILAEASSILMQSPTFNLPRCLLAELEHPGLDKGNRGELIVMILCLEARDAAATKLTSRVTPVNDFMRELIALAAHDEVFLSKPTMARTSHEAVKTLKDTFRNSHMYFNHFVKFRYRKVIERDFLWRLIARGAAGLCADFQYGIDIVIPFLYRDPVLRQENVSALLIQSKNDRTFKAKPQKHIFDMMNPHNVQFFQKKETHPVPIIRMVFALASPTPSVTVLKPAKRTQPPRGRSFAANFKADKYTTFDIWCGKASHETFRPIKGSADEIVFHKLLLRSQVFPNVYDTKKPKVLENVTRNMNPATGDDPAHWEQFSREATDSE